MWNNPNDMLPEPVKDVLLLTTENKVLKGFLNLRNSWGICNSKSLYSKLARPGVIQKWMDMPDISDPRWQNADDNVPEEEPLLIIDNDGEQNLAVKSKKRGDYIIKTTWNDTEYRIISDKWVTMFIPVSELL